MTLRRPSTAECNGVKAEDTDNMVCRIGIRAEGSGAMAREGDPLPKGIEDDIGEGQVRYRAETRWLICKEGLGHRKCLSTWRRQGCVPHESTGATVR